MSDGTNQNPGPGGAGESKAGGNGENGEGTVSYETYKKTVDQEKALRNELKEIRTKLSAFEGDKKAAEEQKKLANDQHLEVISDLKKQFEETNAKLLDSQTRWEEFRKTNAVLGALSQKGIQVDSKYANLIDVDSIIIESDGQVNVASAVKAAEAFQRAHPALAQTKKSNLPGGKTESVGTLTHEEWSNLPLSEMKKRYKENPEYKKFQKS